MTESSKLELSTLLGGLAPSAPQEIDALAKKYRAQGRPVIAFGAGEPDFDTPQYIVDAVIQAAQDPVNHHYTPPAGIPELRESIAEEASGYTGLTFSSNEVAVANGGKQGLYNALSAVLDPGDEVLLPVPYWTSYSEQITLAGGVTVPVTTTIEAEHRVSVSDLEGVRTERTRLMILTSPSNPTGAVYSAEELKQIGEWAHQVGIWVLTDEIYRHFVYDDTRFVSIAKYIPREQLIIVSGLAKSHVLTGWRLGWTISTPRMIKAITSFQSHTTGNVSNLAQRAALAALRGGDAFPEQMREVFDRRRLLAYEMLLNTPGVRVTKPTGAFYVFADVRGLLDGRFRHDGKSVTTSLALSTLFIEEIDVAVVPGEAFGAPGYLRFSYALDDDQLVEGLERIRKLCDSVG